MAAVRCAVMRLSGSLLQRTQAVVAEEVRRLVPSRLMRSRELSSKVSSEHARNIQKKEDDCWAGFNETLKRLDELQKKKKPKRFSAAHDIHRPCVEEFGLWIFQGDSSVCGCCYCFLWQWARSLAQAVTKENV